MWRSGLDEKFKVFLGLTVGFHLDGEKSYRSPILRTLSHNNKLKSDILSSMRNVILQDPIQTICQPAIAVRLDKEAHDIVVERTVRGLYFKHTGTILSGRYPAKVQWHQSLDDELFQITNNWNTGTVGDPALVYKYAICNDDPDATFWVLQFFQKTWSSVFFGPKE